MVLMFDQEIVLIGSEKIPHFSCSSFSLSLCISSATACTAATEGMAKMRRIKDTQAPGTRTRKEATDAAENRGA